MTPLEAIRAKLKAEDDRKNNGNGSSNQPTVLYPFWDLKEESSSVVRFLPDNNDNNTFFWVQREIINLNFPDDKTTIRVPCMHMYQKQDPILKYITEQGFWDTDKDLARQYYKKKSYVFQALIVEDGLKQENPPANPVRKLIVTPQLFPLIQSFLVDPDNQDTPTDYDKGVDFRISKTKKGQFSDYSTSKWSRKERPLSSEERAGIEQYGLFDLADSIPTEPTPDEAALIFECFMDSLNGHRFDSVKYASLKRRQIMSRRIYKPTDIEFTRILTPYGILIIDCDYEEGTNFYELMKEVFDAGLIYKGQELSLSYFLDWKETKAKFQALEADIAQLPDLPSSTVNTVNLKTLIGIDITVDPDLYIDGECMYHVSVLTDDDRESYGYTNILELITGIKELVLESLDK